jgi:hypothetical protein
VDVRVLHTDEAAIIAKAVFRILEAGIARE